MKFDRKIVHAATKLLGGGGPDVSDASASALVAELRAQARRAIPIVADVSGLDVTEALEYSPLLVVDRTNWAHGATQSVEELLESPTAQDAGANLHEKLDSVVISGGVALASRRILGQYDPYSGAAYEPGQGVHDHTGRLFLVAPNIAEFQVQYDLNQRDLCLWVAVHELTHGAQFTVAPWLVGMVASRVRAYIADEEERDLEEIGAIMSLLEGHATYVMNSVPTSVMPDRDHIISSLELRRRGDSLGTMRVWDAVGMGDKLAQYSRGDAFVREVVGERGLEAFNSVWHAPLNMPSPEEIDNPRAWMDRVL